MNAVLRSISLAAAGAALLPLAGCVDAQSALVILQNQIPDTSMGTCVVPGERTMVRNLQGTLDVALDRSYPYLLFPLVVNELPTLGSAGMTVDPNRLQLTSVQVNIDPPPGVNVPWTASCPPQFDYPSQAPMAPGEQLGLVVEGMRACHSDLIRGLFQEGKLPSRVSERVLFAVTVRAKGRHGGTEIKSEGFQFPVRVCFGCLQTGYDRPDFVQFSFPEVPPCNKLSANPYLGNPCNPAQDGPLVLCCAKDAAGRDLQCPAVPGAAPAPMMR